MKKIILILYVFQVVMFNAQDIQLTQNYASGPFLNPAMTGITGCYKVSSSNRIQWNAFNGGYRTNILSGEMPINRKNNALGIMLVSDVAGVAKLYARSINVLYSHSFKINHKSALNFGLQSGYVWRGADYSKYLFADQLARGSSDLTSVEMDKLTQTSYIDFSTGAMYYSNRVWLGAAVHHLNQPNESVLNNLSKLPIKYSFHGGVKIPLSSRHKFKDVSISPAFNYKAQGQFDQFDIGFYYNYEPIVLGIWYRGLPTKPYQIGYTNNDAVAFIAGYAIDKFKIAYSYDITISKLISFTHGAHEITLTYKYCSDKQKATKHRTVACPKF